MKNLLLATAAAVAFAAPVAAQSQLEASLGVSAGAFTTAELIRLDRAREENDQTTIRFIHSGGSNLDAETIERRGVQQAIDRAIEKDDRAHARNLQVARGGPVSTTAASSRGERVIPRWEQKLADDLGVDAGSFTRGELITLTRNLEEGNVAAVRAMISRIEG